MQFEAVVIAISALGVVPIFLLIILTLYGVFKNTGRAKNLSLLGFLIFLSTAVAWLTVSLTRMGIFSYVSPSSDWVIWGRYVDFGFIGIYMFLIAGYVTYLEFQDFFKIGMIIYLIGLIVYEVLMFSAFSISLALFGPAWLIMGLILSTLYMAIIPLFATIRYVKRDRIRGSPQVTWIWVIMLGLLFWFFGHLILGASQILMLPGYNSFFSELGVAITSLQMIGWFIILIGYFFQVRTSQPSTT
ncbi:MAG: hypothetical protein ACFFDV_12835 [Candidatus Thorarchaeota archaeon]